MNLCFRVIKKFRSFLYMLFYSFTSYNGIQPIINKIRLTKGFLYVKICPTLTIRYIVFFVISKFAVERDDCIIWLIHIFNTKIFFVKLSRRFSQKFIFTHLFIMRSYDKNVYFIVQYKVI